MLTRPWPRHPRHAHVGVCDGHRPWPQVLLHAKGRWSSDIAYIYARMTRRSQLAASALMQKARGRDLEEILPGFVQPA